MVHQATIRGFQHYEIGLEQWQNPYLGNSLESHNWQFGWELADCGETNLQLMEIHSKGDPETPEDTGICGC